MGPVRHLSSCSWHQLTARARSALELKRLGHHEGSPCGGLAPQTPTSDQVGSVDDDGGHESVGHHRSGYRDQVPGRLKASARHPRDRHRDQPLLLEQLGHTSLMAVATTGLGRLRRRDHTRHIKIISPVTSSYGTPLRRLPWPSSRCAPRPGAPRGLSEAKLQHRHEWSWFWLLECGDRSR